MATESNDVDWEAIGRERLELTATQTADDIETAIRLLGCEIGRGTADASDVAEARKAIEGAIYVVEDTLVPGVPDAETGGGDTRYIRNDGSAADYLRLTMDQVNEANLGATVELGTEEIRAICSGSGVQVETAAGIEIELLPAEPGETNTGP